MKTEKVIEQFKHYLGAEGKKIVTVLGYLREVKVFLNWLEEEKIHYLEFTYNDLLAYVSHRQKCGGIPITINRNILAVSHFYTQQQKLGLVEYNPCQEFRVKGVVRKIPHNLLEWEALETLYRNYPTGNLSGKRNKLLVGLLVYQGLHAGELMALTVEDVKLEEGRIYIPKVSKSNSRILALEPVQIMELQKYLMQVRPAMLPASQKDSRKLIIGTKRAIGPIKRMLRQMNPDVQSYHQVRASIITHWIKKYDIRKAQYMIGHCYVSSTERYQTKSLDSLQEQLDQLHPLK
jgi:integrase/recombinase XerD